jgi:cytochrome P450
MGELADDVRLLESAWFQNYPHDVYARLRAEAPVFHSERDNIWAITKYEDVRYISRTPALFANGNHVYSTAASIHGDESAPAAVTPDADARRLSILDADGNDSLVMADGPRHAFLRKIASYAFTPRAIARLEEEVIRLTAESFAKIKPETEVDFIDAVAAPVPIMMIARMLGVADEHLEDFRRWSDAFCELGDDALTGDGDSEMFANRVLQTQEFNEFFLEQFAERRRAPKDDLLSAMVDAEWGGKKLTDAELSMMTMILLIAGNETTRGLLSGIGSLLAQHHDQREILRGELDLVQPAVEEFLRLVTPVTHMCRTALDDVEIRGVQVPKGAYVCLLYPAANRDEDIWDDPDRLDVRRVPDPTHVAFGFAEHFCLGANLARREARIVTTELLSQFASWEIVGPVTRAQSHMTPGITKMPVVFHR